MGDEFRNEFHSFAAQVLQHQAKVLQALADQKEQLVHVASKLDTHLGDHQRTLQAALDKERDRGTKNAEVWIASILGAIGVAVSLIALFRK